MWGIARCGAEPNGQPEYYPITMEWSGDLTEIVRLLGTTNKYSERITKMNSTKVISTLSIALMALMLFTAVQGSTAQLTDLSPTEMDGVLGGAKHCGDYTCGSYTCTGTAYKVENGTNGRRCNGSTATACSADTAVQCSTEFTDCNSDCTTCLTSQGYSTTTSCCSS